MRAFVLVHGAGTGGWLWNDVAGLLAADNEVWAPSLIGVGERAAEGTAETDVTTHVDQIIAEIADRRWKRVVLVGFSYGGYVITEVADRLPEQVVGLVYLDAFVPQAGRCFFDALPATVRSAMESAAQQAGAGWRIPPAPLATLGGIGQMEPGVDSTRVTDVLARRGEQPIGTYRQVMLEPFRDSAHIPKVYLCCTDKPDTDPLLIQSESLRAQGWTVHNIRAGHFAMLTAPRAVTAEILRFSEGMGNGVGQQETRR